MSFIEAIVLIRRKLVKKIKRRDWTDNQYLFSDGQRIQASLDVGGIFIADILHADWEGV